MTSLPSSSALASARPAQTSALSQSLPASSGYPRATSSSNSNASLSAAARLRARSRRLSVRQSRGQTEYGFYERLYPHYSEYSDGGYDQDPSESDEASDEDPAGAMDLEDHPDSSQGADQNSSKGKGVAVGYAGRDGKRRSLHSDRKYNLNARRPVITLRKDSGWDFSQDAFFPSYVKEQYTVARPPEGMSDADNSANSGHPSSFSSTSSSSSSSSAPRCCGASLADCDCFDEDLRRQPNVVEIYLTEDDRKKYFF